MLGNKYLCPGWKGDAFPDDCFQGGKRKEASRRFGFPREQLGRQEDASGEKRSELEALNRAIHPDKT